MDVPASHESPPTAELWSHLRRDRRYLAMLGLGFSSGIPYQLVYFTQSDWWSQAGVAIGTIGLLGELAIAYQLKFLWAPFLDSYSPPLLGRWLGRRRAWILLAQLGCMLSLTGVAFGDPGHFLAWTIGFTLSLGVFGATQDAAIDGWRINAAPPGKQALMNSFSEIGYRFGTLASGAAALSLGQHLGWGASYLIMAALLLIGAGCTWLAPETDQDRRAPGPRPTLLESVWTPLQDLVQRLGRFAIPVLVLIAGFRLPGFLTSAMSMPLFKHLHFSDDHIALVTKTFGFFIGITATMFSAWLVRRLGYSALAVHWDGGGIGFASGAGVAVGGRRSVLDFLCGGQHRGFRVCVRADGADHVHVADCVEAACDSAVCGADFAVCFSRAPAGGRIGIRGAAGGIHSFLHRHGFHRSAGGDAGLVGLETGVFGRGACRCAATWGRMRAEVSRGRALWVGAQSARPFTGAHTASSAALASLTTSLRCGVRVSGAARPG